MSTFEGPIKEIPGISLDRFDNDNLSSSAYFLSHMHSDHTRGIDQTFFHHLRLNGRYIYCSRLTKLFLESKFCLEKELLCFIKELTPCSPTLIDYVYKNNPETISVNCVPSGHCPGSVMFIFERNNTRVLCTGDFRILPQDLPRLKPLNTLNNQMSIPLKFDKIYLDTTFLNPAYSEFPTRQQSLEEICRSATRWILLNSKNIVSIECPALYGSEFLFIELMDKLKNPVHVKTKVYKDFNRIPELSRSITDQPQNTRIHACTVKNRSCKILPCTPEVDDDNILTIVVSAYRWRNRDFSQNISEWDETVKNRFYVCCSMHPSYNELKAFVEYFEPPEIHPCVDPPADCKISAIDILAEMRKRKTEFRAAKRIDYDLRSLIGNSSKKTRIESKYFSDDSSD